MACVLILQEVPRNCSCYSSALVLTEQSSLIRICRRFISNQDLTAASLPNMSFDKRVIFQRFDH